MGVRRVRTPHYLGGLGDGNLRDRRSSSGQHQDVHEAFQQAKAKAFQKANIRGRGNGQLASRKNPDRWDLYYLQDSGSEDDVKQASFRTASSWELSTILLLGAVVVMSALFLSMITDFRKSNRQYQRRKTSPTGKTRKKKTDEWTNDEEELLSKETRRQNSDADDAKPVFYPYQQQGLQQHRHRKTSSTSNTVVHQQQPFQQRSYYLSESGGAVVSSGAYKSPASTRPTGYASPLREPASPAGVASSKPESSAVPKLSPHPEPPVRQSMNPQKILSSSSSFDSYGTDSSAHPKKTPPKRSASGSTSPKKSPTPGLQLHSRGEATSHLLLSPGHEDHASAAKLSMSMSISDLVEKTPRASNLGQNKYILPSEPAYLQAPALEAPAYETISGSSETFKFASPPKVPQEPLETDSIPFIPNLSVHVAAKRPPKSINLDDLHLYQMMESGNVSHWEAQVAEESRRLQSQAFTGQPQVETSPPAAEQQQESATTSSSGTYEIASNDPRKSIHHKRDDLTTSTDASSSLQGAVEFSELKLVEVIGGGGFGQVWKAVWRGTPVAVKVLTGSAQSRNVPKSVLEEFVAEINLLKGMRHPNICLYMGACLDPPNRAIITELAANGSLWDALRLPLCPPYSPCDGKSREEWPASLYQPDSRHGAPPGSTTSRLSSLVAPRGSWPWALVKRVACGAARGMAYLHSGKPPVLHRDLKSANILLDDSYNPKVCDFGLSRLKAQERSMTGNCGTVQWMAPEVLANLSYNEKADVYSFGIICWELLTRECPFDGMSAIQCALAVLNHDERPAIPKWCPPSLHALIRACVKKDPDERPTFTQILLALDAMP